jgi:hypothetical protein
MSRSHRSFWLVSRLATVAGLVFVAAVTGCAGPPTEGQATQSASPARTAGWITFGDGTHLVGSDVAPGRYRLRQAPPACYWARLRSNEASPDSVIAVGTAFSSFVVVDVLPTDFAFKSRNCGTWSDDLSAVIGRGEIDANGIFIVGTDVSPGRYVATGGTDCYWVRLASFSGNLDDIIDIDSPTYSNPEVEIRDSDVGFETLDCGVWTAAPASPAPS